MDKVEIHKNICEKLNETYESKNHDYGDAFAEVRKRYPYAINIRLWDKLMRLDRLRSVDAKVKDESVIDTLLDMANYCIMELIEMCIEEKERCN